MKILAYLTFNGTCREAMRFYQECLGGELVFQTVGESPMAAQIPPDMHQCIVHATLISNEMILMGSDMVSDQGLIQGNAVTLFLDCSSEEEVQRCYNRLSRDGNQDHLPEKTFWGSIFGGLTDRYGNNWLVHYEVNHIKTN
jgi:PhnB protein